MERTSKREGDPSDRRIGPRGVGVAHHPLLHDALLAAPEAYDVVEFPLDRYLDEAQRALLDPTFSRIKAVAAVRPWLWRRGPAPGVTPRPAPSRIDALVRGMGAALWRDDVSNGPAANAGVPRVLALPLAAILGGGAPQTTQLPDVVSGIGLDIGAADLPCEPEAAFRALSELPAGRVVDVSLDTQDARAWPLLRAALAATGARRVVVRRIRRLFPLSELFADLDRARAALTGTQAADPPPERPVDAGAATGWDTPSVPAALTAEARRVWREGVAAVHATRQLAQWMERRPMGRIAR